MNGSVSCGSGSNSNSGMSLMMGEVRCHCGKPSMVKKSLTDDNSEDYTLVEMRNGALATSFVGSMLRNQLGGRKMHWWKLETLFATNVELQKLRALVKRGDGTEGKEIEAKVHEIQRLPELENENKNLKQEIAACNEKEKLLRQFMIISWAGFVIVTRIIVNALK